MMLMADKFLVNQNSKNLIFSFVLRYTKKISQKFVLFLTFRIPGVFEFLSKGAISKDHPDLKSFREDSCLTCLSSDHDDQQNFTHSLRLDSSVDPSQIPYTNYTFVLLFVIFN